MKKRIMNLSIVMPLKMLCFVTLLIYFCSCQSGLDEGPSAGLTGIYFSNVGFSGAQTTRIDSIIDANWGNDAPVTGIEPNSFSVRWIGQITSQVNGEHIFYLNHSDGARLMINGMILINNWENKIDTVDSARINLQSGIKYDIRVEYGRFSASPSRIVLEWKRPDRNKEIVPSSALSSSLANAELAFRRLQPHLPDEFLLDKTLANTRIENMQVSIFVPLIRGTGLLYAIIREERVIMARIQLLTNNNAKMVDLLSRKSIEIMDYRKVFNGSRPEQLASFWKYDRKLYKGLENSSYREDSKKLTYPGLVPGEFCPICVALHDVYLIDTITLSALNAEILLRESIALEICSKSASVVECIRSVLIASPDLFGPATSFVSTWWAQSNLVAQDINEYQECVGTAQCPNMVSGPNPQEITISSPVSGVAKGSFGVSNIGFLPIMVGISAVGQSDTSLTYDNKDGYDQISGLQRLEPDQTMRVGVQVPCKQVGVTFRTIFMDARSSIDIDFKPARSATIKVDCRNPKITYAVINGIRRDFCYPQPNLNLSICSFVDYRIRNDVAPDGLSIILTGLFSREGEGLYDIGIDGAQQWLSDTYGHFIPYEKWYGAINADF